MVASLEADAFSALGNLPIKEITPPMVLSVIRAVESRGALDVASRVLQRNSAIFRYAIQTGRASYNPAADMKGVLKTRKVEHRSTISQGGLPTSSRSSTLIPVNLSPSWPSGSSY